MAIVKAEQASAAALGFGSLPVLRQVLLLAGLAGSIAVGVYVAMWSQTPNYQLLYGNLAEKDAGEVMDSLQKANIPFKLDHASGALMVPSAQLHEARLKLATQGLPRGTGRAGFELLEKEQGFGTSQLVEVARFQRALEGELARTIGSLANVKGARVHLALPKQSAFLRDRQQPSASVVLNLYSGRSLDAEQVAGVVHLTASSVPGLDPDRVSVIDQNGHMLNGRGSAGQLGLSTAQFEITRRLEEGYIKRIEDILAPLTGPGRVRAQVVADMDFTITEKAEENYDSEKPALRSEQTSEDHSIGSLAGAMGIPGALSNQPPPPAQVPEQATAPTPAATGEGAETATAASAVTETPQSKSTRALHNYELNKTISHTRPAPGTLRRLSVAVVVDHKAGAEGGQRSPYSEEEITRFTALVKDAVGFSEARGDSVSVINAPFSVPAEPEPLPEPPIWEQPWVWDLGKQVAGGVLVLLLVFGVLRPLLQRLAEKGAEPGVTFSGAGTPQLPGAGEGREGRGGGGGELSVPAMPEASYEDGLNTAKKLAAEDPKRVAQVIKGWVAQDA